MEILPTHGFEIYQRPLSDPLFIYDVWDRIKYRFNPLDYCCVYRGLFYDEAFARDQLILHGNKMSGEDAAQLLFDLFNNGNEPKNYGAHVMKGGFVVVLHLDKTKNFDDWSRKNERVYYCNPNGWVDITDVWNDSSIRQVRTDPTLFRKEARA